MDGTAYIGLNIPYACTCGLGEPAGGGDSLSLPTGHGHEAAPVGEMGFLPWGRCRQPDEEITPDGVTVRIMSQSGARDVIEDPFEIFHHGKSCEPCRSDAW